MVVWHFIVHWTGGDYGASRYGQLEIYDWLSGIAGLSILTVATSYLRKHNCHHKGCLRISRHTVDGSPWCDRHHHEARARAAADGPVRAGTGRNPAQEGLTADGLMVPPAAASQKGNE